MNIFDGFDSKLSAEIISKGKHISAKKNDELYKNGYIGIITEGSANVTRTGSGGNSIIVRTMKKNDIFGAASIFGYWDEGFSSVKALCDCSVVYFSEADFKNLITDYPGFALSYIAFLTDRIRFLNRRLDTFCAGTTQNKLYEYLLTQSDENRQVNLDISMSELARRLGVGRTSLYRDIAALKSAGLIAKESKKIFIK